ncbi:MAG: hypothetical protein Q8O43_04800 [Dehalococcoidia bacterium]|nr:hypothetical protein [Dehalococcoidia bacterium]
MKFLVAVNGLPGKTASPEEMFSRLSAQWMWVRDHRRPTGNETPAPAAEDADITAVGMCIAESESLERLSADIVRMPGAGILSISVRPLSPLRRQVVSQG